MSIDGFTNNFRKSCQAGAREPGTMFSMRNLGLDLAERTLGGGQADCALFQTFMKVGEPCDLLKVKVRSGASCPSEPVSERHRTGPYLLAGMTAILHQRLGEGHKWPAHGEQE